MRQLIRASVIACLLAGLLAAPSFAVTVDDLFNLQANGLGDDILVALIATDGSKFHLSAEDVLVLHRRGLSEKVILAMIASGRATDERAKQESQPAQTGAPAQTVDQPAQTGVSRQTVEVPAGTVVNVQQTVTQHVDAAPAPAPVLMPIPIAVPFVAPIAVVPLEPVFWGFGGRLRTDAWRPTLDRPLEADRGRTR